ncbi:Ammonia transport outward protein 2 [Smittium culicis]|uniref:Ammonia transport outward protein 2 n=1 Tax=Smittium culicis TaxID=133412 RepID=A0A1R1XTE3_9FUNG|nr:Ammonia transport outward protein 2 [Smittium culicis]
MAKFANASPLGLMAFAVTTFVNSLHNAGIGLPHGSPKAAVTGLALFYGGFAQILAGMWDFANGNTLGATAFTSFGAFWMSHAAMEIPAFGIIDSFASNDNQTKNVSMGIYMLSWTILAFILLVASLRTSLVMAVVFTVLEVTLIFLTIGEWTGSKACITTGGVLGLILSLLAFYLAATHLINKKSGFVDLYDRSLMKETEEDKE